MMGREGMTIRELGTRNSGLGIWNDAPGMANSGTRKEELTLLTFLDSAGNISVRYSIFILILCLPLFRLRQTPTLSTLRRGCHVEGMTGEAWHALLP